jgi:hypothetical protein
VVTRLLRTGEAVLVVAAGRNVLGVWPTSVAVAAVAMWWGLRTWDRIETRARSTDLTHRPREAAGHVAFARALATVADTYLRACEAENDPDGRH